MTAPVTASGPDLRALAGIVSDHRDDLPAEGLPPSLLAELMSQIRCDALSFQGFDSGRQEAWFVQRVPADDATMDEAEDKAWDRVHWEHYWDCQPCSYPDYSGDLRSVMTGIEPPPTPIGG
jgi:hypothetical protein